MNQVPNLLNSVYKSLTGRISQLYFIKREYSHTDISTLKVAQISYNPVSPLRAVKIISLIQDKFSGVNEDLPFNLWQYPHLFTIY